MSDPTSSQFSFVGFAFALVAVGVGAAAGLVFVPVVGSFLGMLLGGFLAGLAIEDRPLFEAGIAATIANFGILVAGASVDIGAGAALTALGSIAPMTLLVSTLLSFAVGAFGAHFGDDLREGLTEPLEESRSGPGGPTTRSSRTTESSVSQSVDNPPDRKRSDNEPPDSDAVRNRNEASETADDVELERS